MADSLPVIFTLPAPTRLALHLPWDFGSATAVSDDGLVVGTEVICADYFGDGCDDGKGHDGERGVAWFTTKEPPSRVRENGTSGIERSAVAGINTIGQLVGTSIQGRATLFTFGTGGGFRARSLGALPRRSQSTATAINNAGQVVGWSGNR